MDFDGVVEDVKVVSLTLNEGGEKVFQYGSNCSATRLNSRERLGGAAIPIGIAETVEEYQLQFDVWSDGNNCAAADIVKTEGKKVWGVLYEIPSDFVRGKREDKRKTLQQIEGKSYGAIRICLRDTCGIEQRATTFVARKRTVEAASRQAWSMCVISLRDSGNRLFATNTLKNLSKLRRRIILKLSEPSKLSKLGGLSAH